ncbi:MAG TPA: hypothetical protein VK995_03535, partial [Oceanipulchritudo sp.]|nr:hypothetical protein [Oceanipulchritudo sp.]
MKTLCPISLSCFPIIILAMAGQAFATQVLFVSPAGDDAWTGAFAEPLADGTDGPLATLEGAQAQAREWIADSTKPREEILINFREGDYPIHSPIVLTEKDSGIGPAPVTWQAYPGETVTLNGGLSISGFKLLGEMDIESRIPMAHRNKVYVVNLRGKKIDYSEPLKKRDFYDLDKPGPLQVYYRDELMTLARYPNDGWMLIADVPQDGGTPINKGHHADKRDGKVPTGRHFGAIT